MVPLDYLSIFNSETKEKLIGLCLNRKLIESFNPLTSPGEGVTVFTSPYLSEGAPALGEAKGLVHDRATSHHIENLDSVMEKIIVLIF